jgi:hypothetical protein
MVNVACYNCGIVFGVPDSYMVNRKEDHQNFWCPNGHVQRFVSESDAEKYKRLYDAEAQKMLPLRERLAAEERAHQRTVKRLRRVEKRAAAGVCPCCNRTFQQLARHMESKHKDYRELNELNPSKQLTKGSIQ